MFSAQRRNQFFHVINQSNNLRCCVYGRMQSEKRGRVLDRDMITEESVIIEVSNLYVVSGGELGLTDG